MGIAKFFLIPSSGILAIPVSLMSLNTEFDDEIVLATYQSYISSDIADEAFNNYSIKTIYFENDKEVFNGFASGAFDLAILSSSTLEEAITKGLAKKVEWEKFESIKNKLNGTTNGGGGDTQQRGKISDKLGKLYSPVVSKFFQNSPSLAEYGIPYFISYFAFAYRGNQKLGESSSSTQVSLTSTTTTASDTSATQQPMSWSELMDKISKDSRFKSDGEKPKLGMVEDELTLFSLSKLSSKTAGGSNNSSQIEKLFEKETKTSEDDFYNQYMQMNEAGINKGKLGNRPLFFSPDSVVLSEELSTGDLEGIFFYNGDALYAHQLLEEEKAKKKKPEESGGSNGSEISSREIHIVPLSPALWFMDSIVISSKSNPAKEKRIYEFLERLSFKNFEKLSSLNRQEELGNESDNEAEEKEDKEEEKEKEEKESDGKDRPEWLLGNFTEIGYTPVLQDFNKWIKGENPPKSPPEPPAPQGEENFYKKEQEFLYGKPDMEKCLEQQKSQEISSDSHQQNNGQKCSIVFEKGLNDSQNLNLALAFERWKNNF